jgi:hypothetical protein
MSSRGRESTDLGVHEVLKTTEAAILVSGSIGESVWIPKSVLADENDLTEEGDEGDLLVHYWFAEDRGYV